MEKKNLDDLTLETDFKSDAEQTLTSQSQCFIQQSGSVVIVRSPEGFRSIPCLSSDKARTLALELAGVKVDFTNPRIERFFSLLSHPWFGTLILGTEPDSLSSEGRRWIIMFIEKNKSTPKDEYKKTVAELFINDESKPNGHLVIQEVLSVAAK